MKVELLEDFIQDGAVKRSRARAAATKPQLDPHGDHTSAEGFVYNVIEERRAQPSVPWVKGTIIEMSDTSGQKLIDAGKAREVL